MTIISSIVVSASNVRRSETIFSYNEKTRSPSELVTGANFNALRSYKLSVMSDNFLFAFIAWFILINS